MPLRTEVDLGPGHIVLDGDPAPPPSRRAQQPPLFGPCVLWPQSPTSATDQLLYNKCSAVAEMGDPFATIDMGRKFGGAVPPLFGGVSWVPSSTMWPGPRPTSIPSGILVHPAIWPQQIWIHPTVCPQYTNVTDIRQDRQWTDSIGRAVFERPFVKWFALCYQTVVCPVYLSVCDICALWPNGWPDQDETWHARTPRPWPHCQMGTQLPLPQRGTTHNFRPISFAV